MKKLLVALTAISFLSGCGKIIGKAIESNPEIVFNAIKKDPEGFFNAVESTQEEMKKLAQKKQEESQKKEFEEAFKNPQNPEVGSNRAIRGNKSAPITIVEYADFSCYYCSVAGKTVQKVKEAYGDKVRVLYKHFPVLGNENAVYASQLMEAIGKIDAEKAYKFHDVVFDNQAKLRTDEAKGFLESEAKKLVGAKLPEVIKVAQSDEIKNIIEADKKEASETFKLRGTPAFNINGVTLRGAESFETFKEVIDRHLSK